MTRAPISKRSSAKKTPAKTARRGSAPARKSAKRPTTGKKTKRAVKSPRTSRTSAAMAGALGGASRATRAGTRPGRATRRR